MNESIAIPNKTLLNAVNARIIQLKSDIHAVEGDISTRPQRFTSDQISRAISNTNLIRTEFNNAVSVAVKQQIESDVSNRYAQIRMYWEFRPRGFWIGAWRLLTNASKRQMVKCRQKAIDYTELELDTATGSFSSIWISKAREIGYPEELVAVSDIYEQCITNCIRELGGQFVLSNTYRDRALYDAISRANRVRGDAIELVCDYNDLASESYAYRVNKAMADAKLEQLISKRSSLEKQLGELHALKELTGKGFDVVMSADRLRHYDLELEPA